jgi:2-keto-4-pentenoate hydratase/2-oxohepta-3-ene-1,7-dioic acid hydratase in catechol pathway
MYRDGNDRHLGGLQGDQVVDLPAVAQIVGEDLPNDLLDLIELGDAGLRRLRTVLAHDAATQGFTRPLSTVELLAPLDPPRENILCIGRNYLAHAAESARAQGEEIATPTVFTKAQTAITGPESEVRIDPAVTAEVDWEVELGVVIGRRGINIPLEQALDYVFGYTVVNDISARDLQFGWGGQYFKGKSLDGFCPIGPWIVTRDEIPDPQNLRLYLRVNGETKQDATTSAMIFSVADLVSRLSLGMTLLPGNLIATGTPAGVGFARDPKEFLHPGDVMEAEVEEIGVLRTRMVG